MAEVGLPSACLDDPDQILPVARVGRLLELAARRGPEPAFGLRMAVSRRLSNLGPLGLLMRDQPTLRHALGALVRHIHLHNQAMSITREEADGWVTVREEASVSDGKPSPQATEMALATTLRVLSIFMGEAWRPLEKAPAKNAPISDRVRRMAVLLLPRGHCRADVVAQHLGVTRRTVANHLASEHTTFSGVVDAMRQDLLSRYLAEGTHSLSQVSALLGFSEQSAFSRWHRQRHGVTASARRQARAAPPA